MGAAMAGDDPGTGRDLGPVDIALHRHLPAGMQRRRRVVCNLRLPSEPCLKFPVTREAQYA